jgi:hypothetical protein
MMVGASIAGYIAGRNQELKKQDMVAYVVIVIAPLVLWPALLLYAIYLKIRSD